MEIDYKAPAYLDDLLSVKSSICEIKGAKIVFQQRLLRDEVLLCETFVTVVCVDLTKMKPIAIPEAIRQAFHSIS